MKSRILKAMNWIGEHLGELITLLLVTAGAWAGYLRLHFKVEALDKKAGDTEKTVDDHVTSPVLHRTPDFEKTQTDIKAEIVRVNAKLDRVLELLPRHR